MTEAHSRPHAVAANCLVLALALATACSRGGGGGGGGGAISATSGEIIYHRHRDLSTGLIIPVLSESGSGFDAAEVDSPAFAHDGSRPSLDFFLLYYEATDGSGNDTIGLITSDEEDFLVLTQGRTQVVGLGGGGSGYDIGATDPTVLVDHSVLYGVSGRYHMWFEGRSGAGGATSTIIHCTSADGVTWSSFAACTGLHPTFATVRVADPCVVLDGSTFKMWFEGVTSTRGASADGSASIGYAESTDGVSWTLKDANGTTGAGASPVFTPGAEVGFAAYGVYAPAVVIDELAALGSARRYHLWYEAGDSATNTQNTIGYATSSDGLNWTQASLPILVPSADALSPLPFDSGDIEQPTAYIDQGFSAGVEGHFLLWYTGDGENGLSPNRIGLVRGLSGL